MSGRGEFRGDDREGGDGRRGRERDRDRDFAGGKSPDVAELVRFIGNSLVEQPEDVHVVLVEERNANVYELEVAESDLGKVIGRGGKTARALRTVVQASAPKSRKRTMVEILE